MTDPKPRRFTADVMEQMASLMDGDGLREMGNALRQAASDLRERERIMAAMRCGRAARGVDGSPLTTVHRINGLSFRSDDCPACAIRRAAGLEES